jgi:hypothetical protein
MFDTNASTDLTSPHHITPIPSHPPTMLNPSSTMSSQPATEVGPSDQEPSKGVAIHPEMKRAISGLKDVGEYFPTVGG